MLRPVLLGASLTFVAARLMAAPEAVTATLAGHAILPAQSFVLPPADAPRGLFMAGRFADNQRHEAPYAMVSR